VTVILLDGYVGGWIVTSILVALIATRLQDATDPAPHSALVCILAGAAWPILLVAVAEAGVVALAAEILHEDERVLAYEP
jgi:hypothetical protein